MSIKIKTSSITVWTINKCSTYKHRKHLLLAPLGLLFGHWWGYDSQNQSQPSFCTNKYCANNSEGFIK